MKEDGAITVAVSVVVSRFSLLLFGVEDEKSRCLLRLLMGCAGDSEEERRSAEGAAASK